MKRIIKLSLFLVIGLAIGYMGYNIYGKMELKKKLASQTPMPAFSFQTMDNKNFSPKDLEEGIPVMLIYFNPACDECIEETEQLMKNIEWFENDQIIMVSPASREVIGGFINQFNLNDYSNIKVLRDADNVFLDWFGDDSFPGIYAYNKYHTLAMYFKGSTNLRLVHKVMHMDI